MLQLCQKFYEMYPGLKNEWDTVEEWIAMQFNSIHTQTFSNRPYYHYEGGMFTRKIWGWWSMSNQIHIIQNAITTTISEIFRGDFRRICEVKKAVLHLEAIYFCHGTCYLLKRENMPIKDQLALYQRIELIPQSTTEFFENNRECIINNSCWDRTDCWWREI